VLLLFCLLSSLASATGAPGPSVAEVQRLFHHPPDDSRVAAFRSPGGRVYLDFGEAKPIEREPLSGGTLRGDSFAALVAPPIREAAIIFINGRRAGSLWAPPYRLDVTEFLRDGANEVRVDVYTCERSARVRQGENRIRRRRVAHEFAGVRCRVALLVQG
jgi:hypothetical protein